MHLNLMSWVKLSPTFDQSKWSFSDDTQDKVVMASAHNIVARLDAFRVEYNSLITDLTVLRAKVCSALIGWVLIG